MLCPTAGKPRSFVYQIPLNSNGIPILLDIVDASEVTALQLAQLLEEYLLLVWSVYLVFILCLRVLKFPLCFLQILAGVPMRITPPFLGQKLSNDLTTTSTPPSTSYLIP